tara:strand:+ start:300 stop:803 length:504 start_codon:yes stop_codon:yes gene_type:complete
MIANCMRDSLPFGVVLLRRGGEVMSDVRGSEVEFHDVGTEARVFDFSQTEKGILAVVASGERRFVVERVESASDGLMIGHVSMLADESDSEITEEHAELLKVLIELMKHPLVQELKLDVDLTKSQSVSYRLSDLLPVAPEEKQKLLEIDSAEERLSRLRKIIDKFHS